MASHSTFGIHGLSASEVQESRARHGRNELGKARHPWFEVFRDIVTEPMFILLLAAVVIYLLSGEVADALFMTSAIIIVSGISLYQETRSRKALDTLQSLTEPKCRVIRDGKIQTLPREELVVGDFMMVEEGSSVPADGVIVHAHDFQVDESILTGESLPVSKNATDEDNNVYQGTTVVGGLAVCRVTEVGVNTRLGRIGKSLETIERERTPLQRQVDSFVKKMALVGIIVFLIVWAINFFDSRDVMDSLLKALTLAMSILPEEIPVALTTFMALGAWRLSQRGIIVKKVSTVETLGSATVICADKTGTITENRMELAGTFWVTSNRIAGVDDFRDEEKKLIEMAMWASEPVPFDPMEKALHAAYTRSVSRDERPNFRMVHEYLLGGTPPVMTHIFEGQGGQRIIAVKGAPEALAARGGFSPETQQQWDAALRHFTQQGFRVLGVGEGMLEGDDFPEDQAAIPVRVLGLVAFYDPPKSNIGKVFNAFYDAGIAVKIVTGDNAVTTSTIARQVGFRGADKTLDGKELAALSDDVLRERIRSVNIFTRMFPEAKLRILNALKSNGEVVAMTGDGVNDAPALKAAHIGVAMGKKGSETAKEASSLILTNDDLGGMVDAIAMGRRIYANLKKAIQYVITIHIPIILTVFIPLVLGWAYPAIFSPIHVIFLELIMGPTCSIIYENEPMEPNTMQQRPRPFSNTFFHLRELATSIIQGLAITVAVLAMYQYARHATGQEDTTRAMVFVTLVAANVFLTLVNRSFYHSVFTTLRYKNPLVPGIIALTAVITILILLVPSFRAFFGLSVLSGTQILMCIVAGAVSTLWYEVVKMLKRNRSVDVLMC
ncbi:MAG TPA: cation-translocating P-type ATPase [Cyclobacteriaceae bacterium]